ncbi:MAG: hypothetical protein JKY01_13400 [Pseudomonadales bacterium]|nr:hypothetical protein [Pseudomonadales bacterium]
MPISSPQTPKGDSPEVLQRMWQSHQAIQRENRLNLTELYHEITEAAEELRGSYVHGLLSLEQRVEGEKIHHSSLSMLLNKLTPSSRANKEIIEEIKSGSADKLFINLSIFRSLPDVWGIDQVFPVVPLEHLDKPLTRQVILQDVTCDSDGRIDQYVDGEDVESSLPVAEDNTVSAALYGFFLVGAYQEILGDNHNLFGETDTVDVELSANGELVFSYPEKGDSISSVLESVHFSTKSLNDVYQGHIAGLEMESELKEQLGDALGAAMNKTPYLSRG